MERMMDRMDDQDAALARLEEKKKSKSWKLSRSKGN